MARLLTLIGNTDNPFIAKPCPLAERRVNRTRTKKSAEKRSHIDGEAFLSHPFCCWNRCWLTRVRRMANTIAALPRRTL
jgi:hypothetical protein